jgi:16S rRNA (guanine(966)-N(2))-methyltransferase RsmD
MTRLRVIAGKAKGRALRAVKGGDTRPIRDSVKEALFNIIGDSIERASFLDMFAGTGSVGIEALSRGAEACVFLDTSSSAIRTIVHNLDSTGLKDQAQIHRIDAFRYIQAPPSIRFDFVYIAPPQYLGIWIKALEALDEFVDWLNPDAVLVAQMDPKEYEPISLKHLIEFDKRRYGSTLLVFFELPGS